MTKGDVHMNLVAAGGPLIAAFTNRKIDQRLLRTDKFQRVTIQGGGPFRGSSRRFASQRVLRGVSGGLLEGSAGWPSGSTGVERWYGCTLWSAANNLGEILQKMACLSTVRAEIITELVLERAGPVTCKTVLLELIAFRLILVIFLQEEESLKITGNDN